MEALFFDVKSLGPYGEGFSVGGGFYVGGSCMEEFKFNCLHPLYSHATPEAIKLVRRTVPYGGESHSSAKEVRAAFLKLFIKWRSRYPNLQVISKTIYPVKTNFMAACIRDMNDPSILASLEKPFPFIDLDSYMQTAGYNPKAKWGREDNEEPANDPLADSRLYVRIYNECVNKATK